MARKNYYGSFSLWSGELAAVMFSILQTLALTGINPRLWLTWYLEACAAQQGQVPEDIQPYLPWNLTTEQRRALTLDPPPGESPPIHDTS